MLNSKWVSCLNRISLVLILALYASPGFSLPHAATDLVDPAVYIAEVLG